MIIFSRSGSGQSVGKQPILRSVQSGNIAAVEPYHHVPNYPPTPNIDQEFNKQNEVS